MKRQQNRSMLWRFLQLFKKKRMENSFTNFSFHTISSLTLKKDGIIRSYLELFKIRISVLRGKQSFESKTERGRGLALKISGAIAVLVCIVALSLLVRSPFIQNSLDGIRVAKVEHIEFTGDYRQRENVLYDKAGIIRYQSSMFDVDVEDVAEKIEKLFWVDTVKVSKNWPSTVIIDVKKQIPVALVHTPDEQDTFHYVNNKGQLYKAVASGDDLDYPVITGLEKLDEQQYQLGLNKVLLFLKKVSVNNANLPLHAVSEMHIDEYGELTVYLVDTSFPIYFGKRNVEEAYKYLVRVLGDIYRKRSNGTSIANIGYIQLDYMKDQVLVAESGSG